MTNEDRYPFRYRLLASADIVGSTAFKSARAREHEHWAHVFKNFFDEFPKRIQAAFDRLGDTTVAGCKPLGPLQIWKFVGDEILFSVELKRHEEAVFHSLAFKDALNGYSQELAKKHGALALKGTIWGAGFPVLNVDVSTELEAGNRTGDFLGPSIDLGFRLATQADQRRIPLSADIAYFLLTAHTRCSQEAGDALHLLADPPLMLKGINAGKAYPIIWLDRLNGKQTAEDTVLRRDRNRDHTSLLTYLREHFDSGEGDIRKPFIVSDPDGNFNVVPEEFRERRKKLIADDPEDQYEKTYAQQESQPVGTPEIPPPPESLKLPH